MKRFFFAYVLMVGVTEALRSAAPRCGSVNSVAAATLMINTIGGSSLYRPRAYLCCVLIGRKANRL